MFATKVRSYAKLNLSLNVTGVSGGYHMLDSVVASVNIYDTICAKPRRDKLINVYMHGKGSERIPPEKNNAVKAAERFVAQFQTTGADIEIYKDIPIGAGLGGSSADAAGVLNVLAKLYRVDDAVRLKALADEAGSDTGYMLSGGFARIFGRGDRVEPLRGQRQLWFLLFIPKTGVSTPRCFERYDGMPDPLRADSARLASALREGDLGGVAANIYNALGKAAAELNSDTAEALRAAAEFSPLAYAVTGSGSAVFALFESEEMCRWAKSRYKGKIPVRVVHTVDPKKRRTGARNPFFLSEEEVEEAETGNLKTGAEDGREKS